jgi:hypothetical protein
MLVAAQATEAWVMAAPEVLALEVLALEVLALEVLALEVLALEVLAQVLALEVLAPAAVVWVTLATVAQTMVVRLVTTRVKFPLLQRAPTEDVYRTPALHRHPPPQRLLLIQEISPSWREAIKSVYRAARRYTSTPFTMAHRCPTM